jgi:predicted RND superfamily exporter protein
MSRFTIAAYYFFKKNKILFYSILIISFVLFAFFGSKVQFEEDITKLLPPMQKDDNSSETVFANLKVKDKMFVLFEPITDEVDYIELSNACDEFIDSILSNPQSQEMLNDVLYRLDEEILKNGINELYTYIPTFLDSADFVTLDSLTSKEAIEQQMQENLMTMYSPAGAAFKDMIMQDPLALRKIFMSKMGAIKEGLGGNYTVINQHFFTPDTALAIAFLSPNFKTVDSKLSTKLITAIDEEIEEFNIKHPNIKIHYHGAAPQSVFNSKQIKNDLVMTLSISMGLACLVIGLCYKNRSTLIQLIVPVLYGFLFSLTIIYFIKGQLSLLALGIGAIVLGVALSYCLHVITHYKHVSDPIRVLKEQTTPVFLGCLTTIGSFVSLMFTQAELLKDFGMFASLALIGTTFFCLFFLPQFLNPEKNKRSEKAFEILEKINSYPFERKTFLIIAIVVISIVCLFTSRYVKFDSDLRHICHYEQKVLDSQALLEKHTAKGYITLYFATTSENLDSVIAYNERQGRIFDSLKNLGLIKSYGNSNKMLFIPSDEQQKRIDRWNEFWSEEKRNQVLTDMNNSAIKNGFMPDMFFPFNNLLNSDTQILSLPESNALPSSIKSNMVEYTDGKYLIFTPVVLKLENKKEVCDKITSFKNNVVIDPYYYTSDMVKLVNDDFSVTSNMSSIFVFIVLLIAFRSLIIAIIAFLPMFLSWQVVLGIMGMFGIEFNLINIVISTFIFGIGVDYSIFIMDGLLSDFRVKKNVLVYHKTAIIFSAFVLIVSISSLLFATHPAVKSIGFSTLIGMSSAVLLAYSLEPFMFYWLIKRPVSKGKSPLTVFNITHGDVYFNRRKEMSNKQQIRNNYEYKGIEVEKNLKEELKVTHNYKSFGIITGELKNILEVKCGYGYKSFWFHINYPDAEIIGWDDDVNKIEIAQNCYLKNDKIKFTQNSEIVKNKYDLIILNEGSDLSIEELKESIGQCKYLIVDNNITLNNELQKEFIEKERDDKYTTYLAKFLY